MTRAEHAWEWIATLAGLSLLALPIATDPGTAERIFCLFGGTSILLDVAMMRRAR